MAPGNSSGPRSSRRPSHSSQRARIAQRTSIPPVKQKLNLTIATLSAALFGAFVVAALIRWVRELLGH